MNWMYIWTVVTCFPTDTPPLDTDKGYLPESEDGWRDIADADVGAASVIPTRRLLILILVSGEELAEEQSVDSIVTVGNGTKYC
jgi:hypothetical protein